MEGNAMDTEAIEAGFERALSATRDERDRIEATGATVAAVFAYPAQLADFIDYGALGRRARELGADLIVRPFADGGRAGLTVALFWPRG
jgi:hypothetical protein